MASAISFRTYVFTAALARAATSDEARRWRTVINRSVALRDLTRLAFDVGNLLTGLFSSAEYVARGRTNSQFISDVFGAYFARSASGGEVTTWTAYLGANSRLAMAEAFAVATEFTGIVTGLSPDLGGVIDPFPVAELGGPTPSKELELPPDFAAISTTRTFQDGGTSSSTSADVAPRLWTLTYEWFRDGAVGGRLLDDHYHASYEVLSFDFTDRFGNLHPNTQYAAQGVERDHRIVSRPARVIKLIRRP
jgi:hypothetical protein